jgi:hypothetical protein
MSLDRRAKREREHTRAVEEHKRRIRDFMAEGRYLYAEEHYREAEREGEYARADALAELLPEIAKHNRRVGGGTRRRIHDELSRVAAEEREQAREQDLERARRTVEEGRRSGPRGIGGLSAASAQPDGDFNPGLQAPTPRRGRRRVPGRGRPPWA